MKSQQVLTEETRIVVICPECEAKLPYEKRYAETISHGCTCDCSKCGLLILIENNTSYPFHEKLNSEDPRWPKDGRDTGSVCLKSS